MQAALSGAGSFGYRLAMKTFGQVLESADKLPLEEQESLVSILQRRIVEQRRADFIGTEREARREFKAGRGRTATTAQIIKRLLPGKACLCL